MWQISFWVQYLSSYSKWCRRCSHRPCHFPVLNFHVTFVGINRKGPSPTSNNQRSATLEVFKNGSLLLFQVISATFCPTLAASEAAKLGSTTMAAFHICLQVWLATSLLADGLAVAGQAILANAFARKDYEKVTATASRIVVLTQQINSLAFVIDGLNYGASDFAYSAYSMISVAAVSVLCLFMLSSSQGYVGIWLALSIFTSLRALAGLLRIGTRTRPWRFLSSFDQSADSF